jgi:polyhydroxyalkanoate synthase
MLNTESLLQEIGEAADKLTRAHAALADVGEIDVGSSDRKAIYREQKLTLYRYQPQVPSPTVRRPVLIVYALVNRPYMADLQRGRSLIEGLLKQGLDIYLIDWGYPDGSDRLLTLDDYINGYLDHCVDVLRRRCGRPSLNLLGICQGGTFSLCYAALHPEKVANLITTVTPVDFQTPGDMLSHLVRHVDIAQAVETYGNIPGELLNLLFLSLKPFRLTSQKYVDLLDSIDDPGALRNFMRMEKWIFDSPDQAGVAFREFVSACYQQNLLVNGKLEIGGRRIDLGSLEMPILNIFARDDHLVPPEASKALGQYVGTKDYQEIEFPGGHIGIYVSGKSQQMLPPAIADWLRQRDQ